MSQPRIKKKKPKYLKKVLALTQDRPILQTPGVHHVKVLHDEWCSILKGGQKCDCNPEVEYIATEGRN
jgi:hypothetical protein